MYAILIANTTIVHRCQILSSKKITVCQINTIIRGIIESTKVNTPHIKEKIDPLLS